jgi:hypothetical protein
MAHTSKSDRLSLVVFISITEHNGHREYEAVGFGDRGAVSRQKISRIASCELARTVDVTESSIAALVHEWTEELSMRFVTRDLRSTKRGVAQGCPPPPIHDQDADQEAALNEKINRMIDERLNSTKKQSVKRSLPEAKPTKHKKASSNPRVVSKLVPQIATQVPAQQWLQAQPQFMPQVATQVPAQQWLQAQPQLMPQIAT